MSNINFLINICIHLRLYLLTQVLGLAVFFAVVIKKVDEEDFQNVASIRNYTQPGKKRNCVEVYLD